MIRVAVDPVNPGQFYAACGLFEVADRLWPGSTARFVEDAFVIETNGDTHTLIDRVRAMAIRPEEMSPPSEKKGKGQRRGTRKGKAQPATPRPKKANPDANPAVKSPFVLDPGGIALRVDWWCHDETFKTWAGKMSIVPIMEQARALLNHECEAPALFDFATSIRGMRLTYLDARAARSAGAVDRGYSADAIGEKAACYPAVEFFGMIGLQRFRAIPAGDGTQVYTTWASPLSLLVAPVGAVQCGERADHGADAG